MKIQNFALRNAVGTALYRKILQGHLTALVLVGASTSVTLARDLNIEPVTFSIPPQALESALLDFSEQADMQVMVGSAAVTGQHSPGVQGRLTIPNALQQLLHRTGLTYEATGNTVAVTRLAAASNSQGEQMQQNAAVASQSPRPADDNRRRSGPMEEVIVTAQKRSELLQDVPAPVTPISAEALVENNQLSIRDYFSEVPGLNLSTGDRGETFVAIRGVTTGGYNTPTVGVVVDDVPYGASTGNGGGYSVPDVDPSELERIEVLRGPQGTLYGVSSLGGLIKYVTVDPSTAELSGRFHGGLTSVSDAGDLGYNFRAAVNIPLGDTVAIRASGYARRDPGYIDDPVLGIEDVNQVDSEGGRLAGLWQLTPDISLKLSAMLQHLTGDGSPEVYPALGDLKQRHVIPGIGPHEVKRQAYSATLMAGLGAVDVTSVTGYSTNELVGSLDFTAFRGASANQFFGVSGAPWQENMQTDKFSQEVRLNMPLGAKVEWLIGAFYTDEDTSKVQETFAADASTGSIVGSLSKLSTPTTYKEYAAFTNLTLHIADRFNLQVGGRQSRNEQTFESSRVGPLAGPAGIFISEIDSDEDSFTYSVTPQFNVSPELMLYARLASGYRAGGPNVILSPSDIGVVPPTFQPDKTQNYELGIKGSAFDDMVMFDASVYYIDWKDIQLQALLLDASGVGHSYTTNASHAQSQGVELAITARPTSGLTINAWAAWNDATLTENFPSGSLLRGFDGDRLPYGARWSGNLALDQEFPLARGMTGFVGAAIRYVDDRKGVFVSAPQRQDFPSFVQTDLRAGIKYESWSANLFVNNLTDKRGVLSGGVGSFTPTAFIYIDPRAIGASVSKSF